MSRLLLRTLGFVFMAITASAISCEDARLKCAFRTGCGNALQQYVTGCSAILYDGPADECPEVCQHALIALMSSDEGEDLMNCECADDVCRETKQRVEVCRPHVMKALRNDTIVTCEIAQWICTADSLCATALEYYHMYCKYMFSGRKCSYRCKNSINILRKQEKAAKLDSCRCDGKRDKYNCSQIRTNMARLCFNKEPDMTQIISQDVDDDNDFNKSNYDDNNKDNAININNNDNHNYNNNNNKIMKSKNHRKIYSRQEEDENEFAYERKNYSRTRFDIYFLQLFFFLSLPLVVSNQMILKISYIGNMM